MILVHNTFYIFLLRMFSLFSKTELTATKPDSSEKKLWLLFRSRSRKLNFWRAGFKVIEPTVITRHSISKKFRFWIIPRWEFYAHTRALTVYKIYIICIMYLKTIILVCTGGKKEEIAFHNTHDRNTELNAHKDQRYNIFFRSE